MQSPYPAAGLMRFRPVRDSLPAGDSGRCCSAGRRGVAGRLRVRHWISWACLGVLVLAQGVFAQPAAPPLRLDVELRETWPLLPGTSARGPVFIRGERIEGVVDREVTITGNAELRQQGTVLRTEALVYREDTQTVTGEGQVRLVRDGQVMTGTRFSLRLDTETGQLEAARFFLPDRGGQGSASQIQMLSRDRLRLLDAVYSTCRPEDPDWYIKASALTLEPSEGQGTGQAARVVFKGIPILGAPVFAFPLGDQRRSGFLTPSVSVTSRTGAEIRTPYYFNLAPDRDLTLAPTVMGRRGLQLGAEYRYLQPDYAGEIQGEYLPWDRVARTDRWLIDAQHRFSGWGGWSGLWQLRGVSDDQYLADFSRNIVASSERSLPRELIAVRPLAGGLLRARMLQYQNVLDARLVPPYDRLPQVQYTRTRRDLQGLDLSMLVDASWLSRDLAGSPEGLRLVLNPRVTYPIEGPGWFVRPSVSVHASRYELDFNPAGERQLSRVVPIASIDAGLVMERPLALAGRTLTQTLEPRLFFVNAPYRNQDGFPVFDSAPTALSEATLFSDRIFAGDDRVADTRQLTPGLVTRLIDPESGAESLRLGVAQRWFFSPQRVTIPGIPLRADTRSDILVAASGDLGGGHGFDAGAQFSIEDRRFPQLDLAWRWWPSADRIVNLAFRYRQYDYAQIDLSWRYPVASQWSALGRVNHSVLREQLDAGGLIRRVSPQLLEAVAGFEYRQDCWTLRFVAQNYLAAPSVRNSAFFLQLELDGFARIGLDPLAILVRNIPGYRPLGRASRVPSRFYGYE